MFRRKTEATLGASNDTPIPLKPFSGKGSHVPPPSKPVAPTVKRSAPEKPHIPSRSPSMSTESSKLTIPRDVTISGDISVCDKLIVEGRIEGGLPGARALNITPNGTFQGRAEVEEADISGIFDGDLIVHDKLTVRSGGQVKGTIRYGRITIETGGQISGDMQALEE